MLTLATFWRTVKHLCLHKWKMSLPAFLLEEIWFTVFLIRRHLRPPPQLWCLHKSLCQNISLFSRRSREIQTAQAGEGHHHFFVDNENSKAASKKAPMGLPKKSVLKALKMSVIHVTFFILSWTPYTIIGTWLGSQVMIESLIFTLGRKNHDKNSNIHSGQGKSR